MQKLPGTHYRKDLRAVILCLQRREVPAFTPRVTQQAPGFLWTVTAALCWDPGLQGRLSGRPHRPTASPYFNFETF